MRELIFKFIGTLIGIGINWIEDILKIAIGIVLGIWISSLLFF